MAAVKYLIKVEVHEVKEVVFKDPSSEVDIIPNLYCLVTVGNTQYSTVQKNQASNAVFNASFNFTLDLTPTELSRTRIIISLHHKYRIQSALIGLHAFGLHYIYSKQQHCIHRSWARILCPDFPGHNAGLLLTSVGVFGPGDNVPVFKEGVGGTRPTGAVIAAAADVGHGGARNLRSPEISTKFYILNLNVICGRDFMSRGSLLSTCLEPFVRVCHGGLQVQTPVIKDNPNPEWQSTLYMPCLTPSFDDLVTVEIWNGESNSVLLHCESIDVKYLFNNDYPPRWVNIYCNTVSASGLLDLVKTYVVGSNESLTDYGGRVLISASATQVQVPPVVGIKPFKQISTPPTQKRIVWIDLYEVVPLTDSPVPIEVVVCLGPYSVRTAVLKLSSNGTYKVDDTVGRLAPMEPLVSGGNDSDFWDFFVYINDRSEWGISEQPRVAWKRISYDHIRRSQGKPMWFLMPSVADPRVDAFNLLMSFEVIGDEAENRPRRFEYTLSKYVFRAMIYEALNLPCLDMSSFPNTFVEIELGGFHVRTQVAQGTLCPSFYEATELEILLPSNLVLAPDVSINIYAEPTSMFASRELLCNGHFSLMKVPKEWRKAPQWVQLKSTKNELHHPCVLVAFELVPADLLLKNPDLYPFFDDIRPSKIAALVSLLLIGIRAFKPLNRPRVLVRFGSHDNPIYKSSSGNPISGSEGNWNYLTTHSLLVDLPKRMQHHCYIEFVVISGDDECFGVTYVSLNSFLPWLTHEERLHSKEIFKMQVLEDFLSTGEQTHIDEAKNESGAVKSAVRDDIESQNVKMFETFDFVSLQRAGESREGDEFRNDFDIAVVEDDEPDDLQRDEIPYEMECDFALEDLPYMKAPIVQCTAAGVPETVGVLKYICSVDANDNKDARREAATKMAERRQKLVDLYAKAKELVVRLYVLQAKGLYTSSGHSNIPTYLWVRNSDAEHKTSLSYPQNIRDTTIRAQGVKPVFNACFNLGCALPENAILKISVVEQGTIQDEVIGTTFVDCEDRFLNQKMQQLMVQDIVPIELRTLKNEDSTVSHGTLRCWIEMMDLDTAQTKPIRTLGGMEQSDYELRVVIWDLRGVPLDGNSALSLFVRGIYQVEEGEDLVEETDTHYNSRDGTAVFNWRFKYPIRIPSDYSLVKLQICSSNLLGGSELIGESAIDLRQDYSRIRKKVGPYHCKKFWLDCLHPSFGTQSRGQIGVEFSVLSDSEAKLFAVGKGREAPNKDPFLPSVLENRTYLDWQEIKATINNASGAIMSGLKWTGMFITIAFVFATLLLILVAIK
ncbi:C2 domain-containing protein [Babesia ovata]|uniref:C2 domain-containing protein n=1 Tax=Babesia ovata TaxID=189622 RepID=A0A2H6KCG6_9APIC|nr:C2 domain-containing protein [Babesia ovata]GBE60677.1 C2 domain-containing protein [Babesia ovata]